MTGRPSVSAHLVPDVVFLDRDGTIMQDPGYLSDPARVELLPGATEAIRRLNQCGVRVVIVTNQSGIGRGYYDEVDFRAVQAEVERRLASGGARVDAVYHCPHAPDEGCACRKPGLQLYLQAASELGIDLSRALYVGDRASDVLPALATGGVGLLVAGTDGGYDGSAPAECARAPDLLTGVSNVLGGSTRHLPHRTEEDRE